MKMGTIASPWRYDAAVRHALQFVSLRRRSILRYASRAAVSVPINPGIDAIFGLMHRSKYHIRLQWLLDHLVGVGDHCIFPVSPARRPPQFDHPVTLCSVALRQAIKDAAAQRLLLQY